MQEFIKKWSNWWIFQPNQKELTEAFEKELNSLIEGQKALHQPPVIGSVCPCGRCLDEVDIQFKQCYECGRYWGQTDL
jgi:hypothetical protein